MKILTYPHIHNTITGLGYCGTNYITFYGNFRINCKLFRAREREERKRGRERERIKEKERKKD